MAAALTPLRVNLGVLLGCLLSTAAAAQPAASAPRRVAVLVGANQPSPGRRPLLHAHQDARRLADALVAVSQFRPDDVHVLDDPDPARLMAVVQQAARAVAGGPSSLLYFYYSGHADEQALYPAGQPLPIEQLRRALEASRASVRIGMIDACRGGGWTRTKGLSATAPFEVQLPLDPSAEGTVLIASSSGLESAHESDVLGGSFFTTHFVAGLRGAADRSENGEVTLTEAFEHAKALTIRDTARLARETQHPSYALNLRGRHDLVLAQVTAAPSSMTLAQASGPLEVIHLDSGASLIELAPGRRQVRVALPPGRYLVRRLGAGGTFAKEVVVTTAGPARVAEADLTLTATGALTLKGSEVLLPLSHSTLPRGRVALGIASGLSFGWSEGIGAGTAGEVGLAAPYVNMANELVLHWGITDRLTWAIATGAFAYRFGERGGWEVIPSGGIVGWGFSSVEHWIAQLGAGGNVRRWLGPQQAVNLELFGAATYSGLRSLQHNWSTRGSLGWSATIGERVTLNLAVAGWLESFRLLDPFTSRTVMPSHHNWSVGVGSVQSMALRPLPLVQLHVWRGFSAELHARLRRVLTDERWQYATLLGGIYVF